MKYPGIWLEKSHKFCGNCHKKVELLEFYHIIKHDGKGLKVRVCSLCLEVIDFRFLSPEEILHVFPV